MDIVNKKDNWSLLSIGDDHMGIQMKHFNTNDGMIAKNLNAGTKR